MFRKMKKHNVLQKIQNLSFTKSHKKDKKKKRNKKKLPNF